jgi:hypothetical protein
LDNSPVFNGTILMRINRNGGAFINDQIKLPSSSITYGGTLQLTNVGAALQSGDVFTLFTGASYNGSFANIVGAPGNGLAYSFTNGVLSVVTPIATNPTNLSFSVSGSTLTLTWPVDHLGWLLQAQTNNFGTNWVTLSGTGTTNLVLIPINPTNGSVFYRLVYP